MTQEVSMPVCPYCKKEMRVVAYIGYYDEFPHWECGCAEGEKGSKTRRLFNGELKPAKQATGLWAKVVEENHGGHA